MMETMEYPEILNTAMGNIESASNPYGFGEHEGLIGLLILM